MAGGEDEGKVIVRTETNPHGGTCEGQIFVCADGSRWVERHGSFKATSTGQQLGKIRNNRVVPQ